jgi:hypothetical protein
MARKTARRSQECNWLPVAIGLLVLIAFIGFFSLVSLLPQAQGPPPGALEHSAAKDSGTTARPGPVASYEGLEKAEGKPVAGKLHAPVTKATTTNRNTIVWEKHPGTSCQGYANGDSEARSLEESKKACLKNDVCVAIECPSGSENSCTLRSSSKLVEYAVSDCYEELEKTPEGNILTSRLHPDYDKLLKEYPFQQVMTQSGNQVNIILVRSQMSPGQTAMYRKYQKDILFIGISSMNDYPLENDKPTEYIDMFPAFLHMMREPEKVFPPHVKTLLMSQSDFSLPEWYPARDYSVPKKYDFTYSASDCDVHADGQGWCGWSKKLVICETSLADNVR